MTAAASLRAPDRRRATIIGLVNQYGSVVLAMIQGVVLVRMYLTHIDERLYSAWLASGNIIAWLAFIDPGVSGVIQQRIGESYGKRDFDRVARGVGTGLAVNISFGLIIGALGLGVSMFVPALVGLAPDLAHPIAVNFALAAVSEAVLLCALALASVMIALMARPLALGLTYQACTLLGIISTVVMLQRHVGLPSIPLGLMVRAVALLFANVLLTSRALRQLKLKPTFSRVELREVFGLSGYTWMSRLGTNLLSNVDVVLISRTLGSGLVAPYVLTRRAADVLGQITTRAAAAFAPALSHVHGEGDTARLRDVSLRLLRGVTWLSALALAGFVGLNRTFVAFWVGEHFYSGLTLTSLMGIALIWQAVSSVLTQTLFSIGAIRQTALVTLVEALLKSAVIWALLHTRLGLLGAPLGALIAGLGFSLFALSRTFIQRMGLSPREARALLLECIAQVGLMLALGLAFARFVPVARSLTRFLFEASALGAAAFTLLVVVNRSMREELRGVYLRLRRRAE